MSTRRAPVAVVNPVPATAPHFLMLSILRYSYGAFLPYEQHSNCLASESEVFPYLFNNTLFDALLMPSKKASENEGLRYRSRNYVRLLID